MTDLLPPPGELVDRATYAGLVGIHDGTITTWVRQGVIKPKWGQRGQYPIQVFSRDDVLFGRAVIALMARREGELTSRHAVAIVRGELEQPELGHDPNSSPR